MPSSSGISWPRAIEGRGFTLERLRPDHAELVIPRLREPRNARLFSKIYGSPYCGAEELRALIVAEVEDRSSNVSYAIFAPEAARPIGWMVLYDLNEGTRQLNAAFLLPLRGRSPLTGRAMYPVCHHIFEVAASYNRLDFWVGSSDTAEMQALGKRSGCPGMSLLGIVERQLLAEREDDADHYAITAEQYVSVGPVFEAWEESLRMDVGSRALWEEAVGKTIAA